MFIFTQCNLSAGSTMTHYYKTYKQIQESIVQTNRSIFPKLSKPIVLEKGKGGK